MIDLFLTMENAILLLSAKHKSRLIHIVYVIVVPSLARVVITIGWRNKGGTA